MGPYALGFFAAITIEADNILLDLNGYTIEASLEFALKQRFFNVIQFSSRVFEAHDGMDALNLQVRVHKYSPRFNFKFVTLPSLPNYQIQNGEPLAVQGRSPDENTLNEDNEEVQVEEDEKEIQCSPYAYLNQPNRPPVKAILRNGVVGRSSHNGIHGNGGPRFIVIEDIVVRDFEVAGIQFNGAKDLIIRRSTVGPSGKILVNGLFSSTRFIGFWFAFYYKELWTSEEKRVLLKENYITFADRPGEKINMFDIFARLFLAEQLLVEELEGPHEHFPEPEEPHVPEDPVFDELERTLDALLLATPSDGELSNKKEELLAEARQIFLTKDGLSDGGTMYGINLHRRRKGVHRLGGEVWNFYGPDEDSTVNAQIYDTVIKDLTTAPIEIPALKHTNGICTGPTGEVVRIADWADYDGQFSLRKPAQYRGNMHSDAMVAFFKLANDFWQYSVWGISPEPSLENQPSPLYDENYICGLNERTIFNPPALPSDCPATMNGPRKCEDLAVLHKRFFGSVKFSRELYQWATVGLENGLQTMFEAASDLEERRMTAHTVACGGDTMHHFAKGVFGFKADFGDQVDVWNLTIAGLANKGDQERFFCKNEWTLYGDGGSVGPSSIAYQGTDVHGAVITKSFNVSLTNVTMDYLHSEEGRVIGLDLIGDENGQSQYVVPNANEKANLRFHNVTIGNHIRAGRAGDLSSIIIDTTSFDFGGLKALQGANLPNTWETPRMILTLFPSGNDQQPVTASDEDIAMANLDASDIVEYLKTYYGIAVNSSDLVPIKEIGSNRVKSLCYANAKCVVPANPEVTDVYFKYVIRDDDKLVGGTYAGDASDTQLRAGDELRVGGLIIDRFRQGGLVLIHYYSLNPERVEDVGVNNDEIEAGVHKRTKRSFEYGLFSPTLGYGRAVGLILSTHFDGNGFKTSGTSLFLFDDMYQNFQLYSPEITSVTAGTTGSLGHYDFYMDTRADGRMGGFSPLSESTVPLTSHYFLTHEGGVKEMRRWLGLTDAEIKGRRREFAKLLHERFGITLPFDKHLAKFVDNKISGIVPYAANHDTDLRVTSMGNETFAEYQTTARLIETGFVYTSSIGLIKQGVYIIEYPCAEFPAASYFNFTTITPSTVNLLGHAVIHEEISFQDENMNTRWGVYEAVSVQTNTGNHNLKSSEKHWDIVGAFKIPKTTA